MEFSQGDDEASQNIVEKHADGYVAYPLGLKGIAVGEGSSYEEALAMSSPQSGVISKCLALKFCLMIHRS